MKSRQYRPRIARLLVAILGAGFIQVSVSAPAAQASTPIKPTISSITSGATSLTVNMVTTGITATQWRWSITRRVTSGCANTSGDGAVQSTGSLSATIVITGLTANCVYSVRVAGFNNNVIGEYAESSKLVGGFTNGLLAFHRNEVGFSSAMTRVPFTDSTCGTGTVAILDIQYGATGPSGCNTDGFTSYYLGFIRAPITGTVTFKARSDDGFVLNIQGNNVISFLTEQAPAPVGSFNGQGTVNMVEGEIYRLEAWHHEYQSGAAVSLDWQYSGQAQTVVPTESLATDPSVFLGTCPLGSVPRCAAGSAMEIKLATGTNIDGMYWIMVNGTPTLTYSIMNSAMSGGGWMLAMKGKKSASDLDYGDALWTNTTTLNASYPERWRANDTVRDVDAKYGVYGFNRANQIMAIFPEQTTYAGGAVAASTASPINSAAYGFNWIETLTNMRPWAAYNVNAANGNPAGWGGTSWNIAISGGPTATPTCVNSATTLTNLFSTASRCAFRQVSSSYSAGESPYSAIGQGLFYSQTQIRFFGINYGSANTNNRDRARFGFGWNENEAGNESSSDGTAGIGIDRQGFSSITTGSINACCATQNGLSGGNNTSTNIPFEMYIRNSTTATITGNNLRITFQRQSSLTAATGFTASGTNNSNTFRLSQLREEMHINPSNGVLTVSEALPVGTYQETVTVTDTNGVVGFRAVTIQVLADSSDTDTALVFTGVAHLSSSGTFTLTGSQTWKAWVRPTSACSGTQKTVFGFEAFAMLCINGYWHASFRNSAGTWTAMQGSQRINYDSWTHLAVVRSGTTASLYINNAQVPVWNVSSWTLTWDVPSMYATPSTIYLGGHSGGQFFTGEVDELTIWSEARTLNQIMDSMYAAPNLGSANLFGYWDFNEGSGTSAISRSQISDTRYNFTPLNSQWVTVASTTTFGPYTVVRIPRTLISKADGWRVPGGITAVSVLLVGGGGGGSGNFMTRPTDPGGAGGGGGVYFAGSVPVTPNSLVPSRVGAGGTGGFPSTVAASVRGYSGATTTFSALSAGGGGAGGLFDATNQDGLPGTAGGAGGGASNFWGAYDSGSPGLSSSATINGQTFAASATAGSGAIFNGTAGYAGGGAGGSGSATVRGAGVVSSITGESVTFGVGGGSFGVTSWSFSQQSSFGNGGDAIYNDAISGAQGGSGLVVIRYITALKPAFTQPTNTTLNVGMTETFTVNVALDSATAGLTRTFRWESSTTGSAGTFSTIKQGTGATNAFFAWVPPDTATSGSNFVFRVIVTDSDTAGLFIQETSSAVFATINRALLFTGKNSITKTVGVSKSETFTVLHGTPSYRFTLVPDSAFFWLDTVTATTPRLRIADTATVGTYFETITVIDSVSAAVSIPLTIKVSPPPSFSANAEQVDSGTVLFLDAGNSASFPRSGTSWNDLSGRNLSTSIQPTGMPATANGGPTSCALVEYSNETLGSMKFSSSRQTCAYVTGLGLLPNYTLQVWVKRDGSQTNYTGVIGTPWAGDFNQINMSLHWINVNGVPALEGGIWNGSTWVVARSAAIPDLTWVLATLTFNSLTLTPSLTINNNAKVTGSTSNTALTANLNSPNLLIGKRFDFNNFYFNGSVGSVRVYNRVLTDSEILQNYNATLGRFTGTQNKQSNVGKYGTTVNETITVTAGSETLTASFTSVAIAGLRWDTSTVRSLRVQLQESLTAGTYSDTVTVTDIYGSSSDFPLTFTVGKADTITVIIDTPTALSYTGSPADFTPTVRVTGLVSSDTGTAVSTINYRPGGLTCATGGTCVIGDIGPGGGIVFITPTTVSGNGRFFEAAPANWAGTDDMSTAAKFCTASTNQDNISRSATQLGIGWGETNTALFEPHCTGGAVKLVSDYAGGGFTNWFIPSTNELIELAKVREGAGLLQLGSGWTTGRYGYWGSTEGSAGVMRTLVTVNGAWNIGSTSKSDATNNMVRPVRMFMPCWGVDTCTSLSTTTRPTDAGTYSILPAGLSLTQGNLANYQAILYQSSTVTINRVAQRAIELPFYSPTYPATLTIFFGGGSGTGAVRFVITNGGSATGCAADYRKISTTSVGTCQVQVVKAGDRNHFAETTTAAINFIQFVFTQLAPTVGSGATIALNGSNTVTVDADFAPTISSLSASSGAIGSTITINGAGFFFANSSLVEIKFSRSVLAIAFTLVSDSVITVTVPVGATTSPILVVTPHGAARSSTFTVVP